MDRDIQRPGERVMNQPTKGLRTKHHVHVPLLVPRRPLRSLASSKNPHHVRGTVLDEALLALAFGVGTVKACAANTPLLHQDQGTSEGLTAHKAIAAERLKGVLSRFCSEREPNVTSLSVVNDM